MAILQLENGTKYTNLNDIQQELASLQVKLDRWIIEDPEAIELLAKPELDEAEKERVLSALDRYFLQLQASDDYQSRDAIVLHPHTPNLDTLLAKFSRCHTHADDEVRYIIDGEGVFGFVRPDGSQVELTVRAEEYINVPANTEHWFHLTHTNRVKAIRYFTNTSGWTPEYTDTPIRFPSSEPLAQGIGKA
jgi:1,2-dihydroxy-3-keto-5-methylthiopentene dioxygenase